MDESLRWGRARYAVLVGVCALHLILVIALIIAAKTQLLLTSVSNPIELLILPRHAAPEVSPPKAPANPSKKAAPPTAPSSSAITLEPPAAADDIASPVDWEHEAQAVAASIAKQGVPKSRVEFPRSPGSPFALPPLHHKGDQIPNADGTWSVFITNDCYQVSKSITYIENATNTGKALQTYCNRRSKKPRGDLFESLPAYKKLHPDK
jgi:hypothetical protein